MDKTCSQLIQEQVDSIDKSIANLDKGLETFTRDTNIAKDNFNKVKAELKEKLVIAKFLEGLTV